MARLTLDESETFLKIVWASDSLQETIILLILVQIINFTVRIDNIVFWQKVDISMVLDDGMMEFMPYHGGLEKCFNTMVGTQLQRLIYSEHPS